MEIVDRFLTKMYRTNPDFVFTVSRDFVRHSPEESGCLTSRKRSLAKRLPSI